MKTKSTKRDLSQFSFKAQHWWEDRQIFKRYGMVPDEAKAALIYEGMRHRLEVQQAWINGELLIGGHGWQRFVGFVVQNLPRSWVELDKLTQLTLVKEIQSPWFIPPIGYSTFPDKSSPDKCEQAVVQRLKLPMTDDPEAAQAFVKHARRFEDAGFVFVGIDHKSKQSDAYALRALKKILAKQPPSFRKADLERVIHLHLPQNISEADRQTLVEKEKQGTLTTEDSSKMWEKYLLPFAKPSRTATVYKSPIGKRKRGDKLIEEKRFDFPKLFAELANLDNGKIQQSDFVQRLRLC